MKIPFITDYFNRLQQHAAEKKARAKQAAKIHAKLDALYNALDVKDTAKTAEIYNGIKKDIGYDSHQNLLRVAIETNDLSIYEIFAPDDPNYILRQSISLPGIGYDEQETTQLYYAISCGAEQIALRLSQTPGIDPGRSEIHTSGIFYSGGFMGDRHMKTEKEKKPSCIVEAEEKGMTNIALELRTREAERFLQKIEDAKKLVNRKNTPRQ